MNKPDQDPGYATLAELAAYWRMPSKRAARELARALGLRRVRGKFPWFAIWQAETRRKAEMAIFEYINGLYNPRRRHSALGWKSPVAFERKAA